MKSLTFPFFCLINSIGVQLNIAAAVQSVKPFTYVTYVQRSLLNSDVLAKSTKVVRSYYFIFLLRLMLGRRSLIKEFVIMGEASLSLTPVDAN